MKKIYENIQNTKFVFSKDELGYQEILDDFQNAEKIYILTYNISNKSDELLNAIKKSTASNVTVITNIPSRWKEYFYENSRIAAQKQIKIYKKKIDSSAFSKEFNGYFNFNNHAKIIMTNNIGYVGSSNFSDESANNFEVGFISRDNDFLSYLENTIFDYMENTSIRSSHDNEVISISKQITDYLSIFLEMYNEFYQCFYDLAEARGKDYFYYNSNELRISHQIMENSLKIINNFSNLPNQIIDLITCNCEEPDAENNLNFFEEIYAEIISLEENFSNIYWNDFYDLIVKGSNFIDDYLENHTLEADDEHLEEVVQNATDEAYAFISNSLLEVKDSAIDLLTILERLSTVVEEISKRFNKIVNIIGFIDNTK